VKCLPQTATPENMHRRLHTPVRLTLATNVKELQPKTGDYITNRLRGTGPFLRIRQSLSYSRISQHFMEPKGSSPCSQEPTTGPCPEQHQSSPHYSILSPLRFVLILYFRLRLGLPSGLFWFSHQYPICIHLGPHSCYMPCTPHPPLLDHSNYTWRSVQFMELLIVHFSPNSCHFVFLRPKYSQHPLLITLSLCSSLNVRE
jgi:hypothetical protein